MLTLTFAEAKKQRACIDAYKKFAKFKGGVLHWGKHKPFPLLEVLESNGLFNALCALRYCQPEAERDRIARLFACDCVESVLPNFERCYPNDKRPRQTIEVVRRFANGSATLEELESARSAARSAAESARSAWLAARSARQWQTDKLQRYLTERG